MAEKRKPPIRQRPIQVRFFVDEKDLEEIYEGIRQILFLPSKIK